MNNEEFGRICESQAEIEKAIIKERADAYATGGDRLGGFYAGGELNKTTPMKYGYGLVSKHIIALRDLIDKLAAGKGEYTEREAAKISEYVTDIRVYAVLLKALYLEEQVFRLKTEG